MKTLRFGCIGCGSMGLLHTLNAHYVPGLEVVAYADADKEKADRFLQSHGGEYATDDASRIFQDQTIDGVFIITGERHHPKLGIAAANAGKHIFMEKPIAVEVEDAIELERAVRRNGVKYLIGFCNRLAPMVVKARELISEPWITICQSSSTVAAQANHHLDLMLHMFHRAPLESVYASGGHAYGTDTHLAADSFIATLRFADGSQSSLTMHGQVHNSLLGKYSMQLFGRDRTVYLGQKYTECHLCTTPGPPDISFTFQGAISNVAKADARADGQFRDARGPHGYMGHYEELAALRDAIWHDTEPPMTVEHGRHVLQVEKAIFESVSTNQVIGFPQFLARWDSKPPEVSNGV